MPRRQFIVIICLAVCAIMVFFMLSRRTPEATFHGRYATYWLCSATNRSKLSEAIDAFRHMGTNAEPVLVAAIVRRNNALSTKYLQVYQRLSPKVQRFLPGPTDPQAMRGAAGIILLNYPSTHITHELLPFLPASDSEVRLQILYTVSNRIGPSNVSQVPFLLTATNDPDANVRVNVGWALWKVTGQIDFVMRVLEDILRQGDDGHSLDWVTRYMAAMGRLDPAVISILTNSVAGGRQAERGTACGCLGQIGPPAAAAIPSLRAALHDPSEDVRHRAEFALKRIELKPVATDLP